MIILNVLDKAFSEQTRRTFPGLLVKSGCFRLVGFTTPEILMALMVFSFGLLPLIVLFQNSHKVTAQAKNLMVAQTLGRTIIDEIRSYGVSGIKKNFSDLQHSWKQVTGPIVPSDPNSLKYPDYYGRFETMTTLDGIPDKDNPEKYRVALTVRWKEQSREFTLCFGSVVVKYGAK